MKTPHAIIIGSVLIALAILGTKFLPIYQIYASRDAAGNPMLWRVNVLTGDMEMCLAANILEAKKQSKDLNPFAKFNLAEGETYYGQPCR
jgi:hypothetical protein